MNRSDTKLYLFYLGAIIIVGVLLYVRISVGLAQ